MSGVQETIGDGEADISVPADHLTFRQPPSNIVELEADPERGEYWCRSCGARVTRSGTGQDLEYGHERGCEYRVGRER